MKYCQKHFQNIHWRFIPHVAVYRLPVWNGDYENPTKRDIKHAIFSRKIIIHNVLKSKQYIRTAYSSLIRLQSSSEAPDYTSIMVGIKWQLLGNLLAYGVLQEMFILLGTEIHTLPDGCTTACHQTSCKKQQRLCFLRQMYNQRGFSL